VQQECSQLQRQLQAHKGQGDQAATAALTHKFELALQAIGKLQEQLETTQSERDELLKRCQLEGKS